MRFKTFFLFGALFSSLSVAAFTLPVTEGGKDIRWRFGQKLFVAGNPAGRSGIPADAFRRAIVAGLQQWKWATRGILDFDYWQGVDPGHYPATAENDGLNAVFFASNSNIATDPNVIGFTQLLHNSTNGDIIEADILLNDRDFQFTTEPSDTPSSTSRRVFLDSVVTHELGHVAGLSHSAEVNASMLYVGFLEQSVLGCDDQLAARQAYLAALPAEGSLSGTILSPFGAPIVGARVTALSKSRGVPLATAHTDGAGSFFFLGLEAGTVSLMVSPYSGPASAIPLRHRPTASKVCEGSASFPWQFFTRDDRHQLEEFEVAAGRLGSLGARTISCAPVESSGSLYQDRAVPDLLVDSGPLGKTRSYLYTAEGPFRITGLGFLLHSPVSVDLSVHDSGGKPIPFQREYPLYQSVSGYRIDDVAVSGFAIGRVEVRVTPRSLATAPFPSSIDLSDSAFYSLGFSSKPAPANPRCLPPSGFPEYTSPSGHPPRFASTRSARDGLGFCAKAEARPIGPRAERSRPMPPIDALLGWFLPFLPIGLFQLNSVLRRIRLKPTWQTKP